MICKTLFHSYKVQIKANRTILFRDAYISGKTVKKKSKEISRNVRAAWVIIKRGRSRVVYIPRASNVLFLNL